jgi:hypothetical protein
MASRPVSSLDLALVTLFLLFQSVISSSDDSSDDSSSDEQKLENWYALARYLIALGFIIVGATQVLYGHVESYKFLKGYQNEANRIAGQVLSCDELPGHIKKYEMQVLYSAPAHKCVNDRRSQFRYPDALVDRYYLRRFETNWLTPRGSLIELLLLRGLPRSACTNEMIDSKLQQHSHTFTVMILVPSLILLSAFLYLSIAEIQKFANSEKEKWIAGSLLTGCLILYIFLGWSTSEYRFQQRTRNIFLSAVPMRKKLSESHTYV